MAEDYEFDLRELDSTAVEGPISQEMAALIEEGLRRAKRVDCFDFVPSNYAVFHATLLACAPGRFCEWGSGIGIATGMAHMLGFEACGIELSPELAEASRRLLHDFGIAARIMARSENNVPFTS